MNFRNFIYSCRCTCKVEERIAYVLVFNGHNINMINKYSLQTKDPKKTDKKIFETQVKLQAGPQQIHGQHDSITTSIG